MNDNFYDLGEEEYAKGNYKIALTYFEKASLHPNSDCLNYIGCCHLSLGNYDVAINIFNDLMVTKPDWERLHKRFGNKQSE